MMYLHKYGALFRTFYPSLLWKVNTDQKVIYLTFDDGPIPEVTEYVLDELHRFGAKATFFCVGENVRKHPQVFERVVNEGHAVGNHTQHHLNGRQHAFEKYIQDAAVCDTYLEGHNPHQLFRPPYGRMTYKQLQAVKEKYRVVMWDVLGADFHPKISQEQCLLKCIQHTEKGSVVLLHDSIKTFEKLQFVLPRYLQHFTDLGFEFKRIENE